MDYMARDRTEQPVVLSRIYTRTGDDGTTALGDTSRVPKTDPRLAAYADVELLVKVGEYKQGSDPDSDMAIAKYKSINSFLQQAKDEFDGFNTALGKLAELTK